MYTFFDLSSTKAARIMAATGALIVTVILMAGAIVPASPNTVILTTGVLA
ncbi:hypothetical protein [Erythrobacter longus]|nr:hypothetical protein [Erythrobacter longus]